MDQNASNSLDEQVVAMMNEGVETPTPSPETVPATAAEGSETPPAAPPEPAVTPTPSAEGSETPPAPAEAAPSPAAEAEAPPAPAHTKVSTEDAQAIINEYVSKQSGGVFNTAADLETAKGFEVLATVPLLTEQLQNLKKNEVVFSSPLMESLNKYEAQGGKNIPLFIQLQKLNVAEMEPELVIKTKMQMGEIGLTSGEIDAHIIDKYHRYDEDHEHYDAAKAARGNVQMKIDAAEGRTALIGMQSDIKPLDVEAQQALATEAASLEAQKWESVISSSVNGFSGLDIPLGEKDQVFKYAVPEESKVDMTGQLREMIESSGATHDHEGAELVKELHRNRFIIENFDDIIKAVVTHIKSQGTEQRMEEQNNPSAIQPEVAPTPAQERSAVDQVMEIEGMTQPTVYQ